MLSLAGPGEGTVPSYSDMLAKVEAYVVYVYLRTVLDKQFSYSGDLMKCKVKWRRQVFSILLPVSSSRKDLDVVIRFHSLSSEGTTS